MCFLVAYREGATSDALPNDGDKMTSVEKNAWGDALHVLIASAVETVAAYATGYFEKSCVQSGRFQGALGK